MRTWQPHRIGGFPRSACESSLARQGEAFDLDYKTILDIQNDPRHRLRLVKLVAAMTGLSGDIVVGADARGTPTGQVTPALAQVHDEANLRPILLQYLPPALHVHSQTHAVDGQNVVLIHVEAGDGGPLALTRDGIYHDANNQPVYEFRAGERYIRDGTSNALFTGTPHQVNLLLNQRATAPPAVDPADSMTFDVAPSELAAAARELLRRRDDVPLRMLLGSAEARNGLGGGVCPGPDLARNVADGRRCRRCPRCGGRGKLAPLGERLPEAYGIQVLPV